ncbi:inosine/xanthosine triphosphatase [Marinoscillum pacificum]|uniref:inosine/xanthosine triphosphatase n=1 Tax=Marinoscillum pacificum TaxID=392723 RepID=UPI0021584332|nr:inosine/xanthosine triphosphatase [Marinoscillum pacificum]
MQKVIVASKNPVKINCTKEGFEKIFTESTFVFEGVSVPSDVSDQPMTDEETLQGAINRARNARQHSPDADFWVGIEGGIDELEDGMIAFAWVAVLSNDQLGKSRTSTFYLPPKVVQLIHEGIELGYANDQVFGEKNSKHKGGAVGSLTGGVLGRTEYYVQAVILALVPFRNPEIY